MNVKVVNVLITGVGGDQAVFIWKALKKTTIPIKIVGCDCRHLAVGLYRADVAYLVPSARSGNYLQKIIDIIKKEKINIIMAGDMEELDILSQNAKSIEELTGAYVVAPPREAFDIAKDKWSLVNFLKNNGFPYPITAIPENKEMLRKFIDEVPYPYIVKDRISSGSRGLHVVNNINELNKSIDEVVNPIIQEYLFPDDEEYTIGCFCDFNRKAIGSIVMKRTLAHGLTHRAQVLKHNEISSYCEAVAEKLGFVGPLNLQLRLTKNGPVIFEINPRFSSTESARAFYNYNVPEMCIKNFVFREEVKVPETTTGHFFRIYDDVFVDTVEIERMSELGFLNKTTGQILHNF